MEFRSKMISKESKKEEPKQIEEEEDEENMDFVPEKH